MHYYIPRVLFSKENVKSGGVRGAESCLSSNFTKRYLEYGNTLQHPIKNKIVINFFSAITAPRNSTEQTWFVYSTYKIIQLSRV